MSKKPISARFFFFLLQRKHLLCVLYKYRMVRFQFVTNSRLFFQPFGRKKKKHLGSYIIYVQPYMYEHYEHYTNFAGFIARECFGANNRGGAVFINHIAHQFEGYQRPEMPLNPGRSFRSGKARQQPGSSWGCTKRGRMARPLFKSALSSTDRKSFAHSVRCCRPTLPPTCTGITYILISGRQTSANTTDRRLNIMLYDIIA